MRRRDDGAAAVEFALISTFILLPLLFGLLQYGYFFYQSTGVEHGTLQAARAASLSGAAGLEETVAAASPGVDEDMVTVAVCWEDENGDDAYSRGDTLEVTVTWTPTRFALPVPFLTGDLQESAATRVERVQDVDPPARCPPQATG